MAKAFIGALSHSMVRRHSAGSVLAISATCVAALLLFNIRAGASQQPGVESASTRVPDAFSAGRAPAPAKEDPNYALAGIGDVNRDGVADIAVADATQRQVAVFSGAIGNLLYVFDVFDYQKQADFGQRLSGVEDVNGDGVPDIAVENSAREPVAVFSGRDGAFLFSQQRLDPQAETILPGLVGQGRRVSRPIQALPELGRVGGDLVVPDVSGDGVSDIAVEGPSDGEVLVYSGADGSVLHGLRLPWPHAVTDASRPVVGFGAFCFNKAKYVEAGDWRTLETFWGGSATGYFYFPAGAQIKVRYGVGWFGYDSDKQTLDGRSTKTLRVGGASIVRARMQMKFGRDVDVYYTIC